MNNENNKENNESALVKLKEWYTGIPLVTRTFMTLSFAIPLLMQFGFLQSKTVALIAPAIYEKLQVIKQNTCYNYDNNNSIYIFQNISTRFY